jgi:hypothetical protein
MTDLRERDKFLNWETASRDTIDFKKLYVDMTGDHLAALALSEIVYWHLPNQQGQSKLRVNREGELWIAVPRYEWWDRTRMTPRQIDSAMKKLVETKLVVKKFFAFNRAKTTHVRINWDAFLVLWNSLINAPLENPYKPKSSLEDSSSHQTVTTQFSPNGEHVLTDPATPITETTTETTKKESLAPKPETTPLSPQLAIAVDNAAEKAYQPIDTDTAAMMQGDVLMRTFETICKERGAPQTITRSKHNRRIAAQYYRDGYTPDEVKEVTEQAFNAGKVIPFAFMGEKLSQNRAAKLKAAAKSDNRASLDYMLKVAS